MYIKIALFFSISFAAHASALLAPMGKTEAGRTYIRIDTIRKQDNYMFVWQIWDYDKVQVSENDKKYLSSKILNVYNCKEHTGTIKAIVMYSEEMNKGQIVESAYRDLDDTMFVDLVPDSIGSGIFEIVCDK